MPTTMPTAMTIPNKTPEILIMGVRSRPIDRPGCPSEDGKEYTHNQCHQDQYQRLSFRGFTSDETPDISQTDELGDPPW